MTDSNPLIQIAIVEDNTACRDNLRMLLNTTPRFACPRTFADAEAALEGLSQSAPDLLIVDLDLPGMSGEQLLRELRARHLTTRPVVLTAYNDPARIGAALEAGAFGYLLKGTAPQELIARLRDAHAGGAPMSPAVSLIVVQIFHRRGEIEGQLGAHLYRILRLLANGHLIEEIAVQLGLAPSSVRANLSRIYDALHVKNASQAVAFFHGAPRL